MTPEHQLASLLETIFDEDELRSFLLGLPNGPDLLQSLPTRGASSRHLCHETTLLLVRRGLVDEPFFRSLATLRPNNRVRIQVTWEAFAKASGVLHPPTLMEPLPPTPPETEGASTPVPQAGGSSERNSRRRSPNLGLGLAVTAATTLGLAFLLLHGVNTGFQSIPLRSTTDLTLRVVTPDGDLVGEGTARLLLPDGTERGPMALSNGSAAFTALPAFFEWEGMDPAVEPVVQVRRMEQPPGQTCHLGVPVCRVEVVPGKALPCQTTFHLEVDPPPEAGTLIVVGNDEEMALPIGNLGKAVAHFDCARLGTEVRLGLDAEGFRLKVPEQRFVLIENGEIQVWVERKGPTATTPAASVPGETKAPLPPKVAGTPAAPPLVREAELLGWIKEKGGLAKIRRQMGNDLILPDLTEKDLAVESAPPQDASRPASQVNARTAREYCTSTGRHLPSLELEISLQATEGQEFYVEDGEGVLILKAGRPLRPASSAAVRPRTLFRCVD